MMMMVMMMKGNDDDEHEDAPVLTWTRTSQLAEMPVYS